MSLKKALLAATILALPVAAQAQPVNGLYIAAGAGVNWLQESDITLSTRTGNTGAAARGSATFDMGFVGVLSLGYGFGNGIRAELELSYRQNEVDRVGGFGNTAASVRSGGSAAQIGAMVNAFYDFNLGAGSFMHPYIGVGLGMVNVNYDDVRQTVRTSPSNIVQVPGNEWVFGYQAIVGAAFPITAVPGLAVTAEYRFMGTMDAELTAHVWRPSGRSTGTADVESINHSVLLGLRYAFGVTPPPAVVPPVEPRREVVPARTFLVFFDFDRADLTDRARQIIAEAATSARTGTTRIEVSGHADRSGTPQYNQRLSERRAAAVAAELERRGVARSAMVIQAFGESRPLVPTADGVREPQNRRVEIVLR